MRTCGALDTIDISSNVLEHWSERFVQSVCPQYETKESVVQNLPVEDLFRRFKLAEETAFWCRRSDRGGSNTIPSDSPQL